MNDKQLARFMAKVIPVGECWMWRASTMKSGYGKFSMGNGWSLAHRVSYVHWNGPIVEGKEIDHLCRNVRCVNPKHLEAVPHVVNSRRSSICKDSPVFRPVTNEHRRKIGSALMGIVRSEETRAKIRASWIRRKAKVA